MATTDRPRPPSVDRVLSNVRRRVAERDADAVLAAARQIVDDERARISEGGTPLDVDALGAQLVAALYRFDGPDVPAVPDGLASPHSPHSPGSPGSRRSGLTAVINATGVIVHTNLGRASWPRAAVEAARMAAEHPTLLELDRSTGRRGTRFRAAEEHLIALTGAEDALVVTNNAAAIALAVGLAGRGGGVAVSRGELVEIGGGVRIPEILRSAGVRLVEVGTTNRTRVADFAAALEDPKARIRAVLRVHPSNFVQTGYVESPDLGALAAAAHRHGVIVIDDLGSGALLPTERVGLAHEPMPRERLDAGADLVTFSGDKLVGGPQAGLIVGRADLIARLRGRPLARAMRPDKTILAGVAATLGLYRSGRAMAEIPVWRMLSTPTSDLRLRAGAIVAALPAGSVAIVDVDSTVGGGSVPGQSLPSVGLELRPANGCTATQLLGRLRDGEPCVIARIERDRAVLDLRSVDPGTDADLMGALTRALAR